MSFAQFHVAILSQFSRLDGFSFHSTSAPQPWRDKFRIWPCCGTCSLNNIYIEYVYIIYIYIYSMYVCMYVYIYNYIVRLWGLWRRKQTLLSKIETAWPRGSLQEHTFELGHGWSSYRVHGSLMNTPDVTRGITWVLWPDKNLVPSKIHPRSARGSNDPKNDSKEQESITAFDVRMCYPLGNLT